MSRDEPFYQHYDEVHGNRGQSGTAVSDHQLDFRPTPEMFPRAS